MLQFTFVGSLQDASQVTGYVCQDDKCLAADPTHADELKTLMTLLNQAAAQMGVPPSQQPSLAVWGPSECALLVRILLGARIPANAPSNVLLAVAAAREAADACSSTNFIVPLRNASNTTAALQYIVDNKLVVPVTATSQTPWGRYALYAGGGLVALGLAITVGYIASR
jgi:hypothetical protein